jgi:hypothetical protein
LITSAEARVFVARILRTDPAEGASLLAWAMILSPDGVLACRR